MNQWNGFGRTGEAPEIRTTTSGKKVTSFSLAVHSGKDETTWLKIEAWDKTAELCARLAKGESVGITGEIKSDDYVTKAGEKRKGFKINASRVHFAGGNKGAAKSVSTAVCQDESLDVPF